MINVRNRGNIKTHLPDRLNYYFTVLVRHLRQVVASTGSMGSIRICKFSHGNKLYIICSRHDIMLKLTSNCLHIHSDQS